MNSTSIDNASNSNSQVSDGKDSDGSNINSRKLAIILKLIPVSWENVDDKQRVIRDAEVIMAKNDSGGKDDTESHNEDGGEDSAGDQNIVPAFEAEDELAKELALLRKLNREDNKQAVSKGK